MATPSDSGPTHEEFARLLAALDPDPKRAGEKYESLRQRLITYLRIQGFHELDDLEALIDRSFDITACKLGETHIENVSAFVKEVARRTCLDALKKRPRLDSFEELPDVPQPGSAERELAQECLDQCMRSLKDADQKLILGFYTYLPGEKAASKARTAALLGLSGGALRKRAHDIRRKLEDCVRTCMRRFPTE